MYYTKVLFGSYGILWCMPLSDGGKTIAGKEQSNWGKGIVTRAFYDIHLFWFCFLDAAFRKPGTMLCTSHTVILTHWDSLEQLPVSCTDGQNTHSMLYVFWMHCTDCICSAVCYSKHLNTGHWSKLKLLLRPGCWCSVILEKCSSLTDLKEGLSLLFPHR